MKYLIKGELIVDPIKVINYIKAKNFKWDTYPINTLLVLDDFAGHPLLSNPKSELSRMLTKLRHYNITVLLAIQTWIGVPLNFKRNCTDIVIYRGYSNEDFERMIKQTSGIHNVTYLTEIYKNLKCPHSNIVFHCNTGAYEVID